MDDSSIKTFFDSSGLKEEIMSYCDTNTIQKIIINFSKCEYRNDKSRNVNNNIVFVGFIDKGYIDSRVIIKEPKEIIFPRKSFKNMLLRFFNDKNKVIDLLKTINDWKLEFKRINKKRYELIKFYEVE